MNSRIYPEEIFIKQLAGHKAAVMSNEYKMPLFSINELSKIRAHRNLEIINQLIKKINKRHCE